MFKNYLLTAFKVLQRRKFFTFVNVFGIAITLAILTVMTAVMENTLYPKGAEHNSANILSLNQMILTNKEHTWVWNSPPGYRFIRDYLLDLETPDRVSFYSGPITGSIFQHGQKHSLNLKHTDSNYWKMLDFELLEGRILSTEDVDTGQMFAVINLATQNRLFPNGSALQQKITVNGQRFEVIGVVKDESELSKHAFSDIWVPYTTHPSSSFRASWMGDFRFLMYVEDGSKIPQLQQEFAARMKSFDVKGEPFSLAIGSADTKLEAMSRGFFDRYDQPDSGVKRFYLMIFGGILAFMLLPTINLINLNVSRIMERSAEIGVRRAFGAKRGHLIMQFMVENLFLTLLGGLVGLALGVVLLNLIEVSDLFRYAAFQINWRVFVSVLGLIGLFSFLSGAYPAWKMSRMHPVSALKGAST